MPDEIEACTPWLRQTLAIVDPRIIVTLGNFATRYMLDRPVGISRVRGERFHVDGRIVIPTFHPAAVLRGGGAASKQMEAIRADFAAVRQALADRPEPVEEQLGLFG
jgi:DNA polymerase